MTHNTYVFYGVILVWAEGLYNRIKERNEMIVVWLGGGLGNQMFQYALGRRLAIKFNVPLKLDISWFGMNQLRTFKLLNFNISADIASVEDTTLAKGHQCNKNLHIIFEQLKPYYRRSWVRQQRLQFDPNVFKVSKTIYLEGYWQSERYFKDIDHILHKDFTLKSISSSQNQAMAFSIYQADSISLHVRRGDYVSNPQTSNVHGICSLNYYENAIATVSQVVRDPHFFIFSDDIEWVKQNLKMRYPATYIVHNGAEKDFEDLHLMSLCKHHIIANSTFSWWGAWLCTNPDKIVVAPQKWFNTSDDSSDIVPASWLRLS